MRFAKDLLIDRLMVITESQPATFGIVSRYVPVVVQVLLPLGEVYPSQAFSFITEKELLFIVRKMVMIESHPDALGMVSRYVPEVVQVCVPPGEV